MTDTNNGQKPKTNGKNGSDTSDTGPIFAVNNIYIKDLSFEAPQSPQVFDLDWTPHLDFDLQMGSQVLSEKEGLHEVSLNVTVKVALKEKETAFLIEVIQAGIFKLQGFLPEQLKFILSSTCPGILFPYVREVVSNVIQKGGFPQLILPPINFEAMYVKHLEEQENNQEKMTTV